MHNLSLIQYIEDAQIEFTCAHHTAGPHIDVRWATAQRNVTFLRPLPILAQPVDVVTGLSQLGRCTMTLTSRIEYQGLVHTRSEDRFLACDESGARRRLGGDEMRWLRQFAAEGSNT
ncbi:hypothetical protein [Streptomyces sp. NPDC047968]|uniref:hypothetical protein n=1 Tax=unclassified Streptomyces TaxID=2593676 RepID=UPI003438065F